VYRTYWNHSYAGGRWSNPTLRVHYALHRVFASYIIGSIFCDFVHNVGINDEIHKAPRFVEAKAFGKLMMVVLQARVQQLYAKGNQIVIVVIPQRTGLHVLTINTADVPSTEPITKTEPNLIQLVTENGHEIDYWVV
jgi:hypothetical protein